MISAPPQPAAPAIESIDLEQLFPRRDTVVFAMKVDAPLFFIAAGDLVVCEMYAAPSAPGALAVVILPDDPTPRVRRLTLNVRGKVASLASGVAGERELHLPAGRVRVLGRVVGVIRRYVL